MCIYKAAHDAGFWRTQTVYGPEHTKRYPISFTMIIQQIYNVISSSTYCTFIQIWVQKLTWVYMVQLTVQSQAQRYDTVGGLVSDIGIAVFVTMFLYTKINTFCSWNCQKRRMTVVKTILDYKVTVETLPCV